MVLRTACGRTVWDSVMLLHAVLGRCGCALVQEGTLILKFGAPSERVGLQGWRGWTPCLISGICVRLGFSPGMFGVYLGV